MRKLSLVLLAAATAIAATAPLQAARARKSPHETISTVIGNPATGTNHMSLTYGRPYSKDPNSGEIRVIWGTLVPWGDAYRLGADEATTLITEKAIVINGKTIPAGTYTVYMVPSENGTSRLAFSTNIDKWGIPVDETHDLVRVDLKKQAVAEQVDQLTLALEGTSPTEGVLKITWEKTQYSVAFQVKS